jgi:hypothetical protein
VDEDHRTEAGGFLHLLEHPVCQLAAVDTGGEADTLETELGA